jgi:hypothetical protein
MFMVDPSKTKTGFQSFSADDSGLEKVRKEGLVKKMDKTVSKEGKSVTVTEAYYDKSRISIGVAAQGEDLASQVNYELSCNGQPINCISGKVDEHSAMVMADKVSALPERFDLKFVVKEKRGHKNAFEFEIPLDRIRADKKTKEILTNKEFSSKNLHVRITDVLFTTSSTTVSYEYTKPNKVPDYIMELTGESEETTNSFSGSAIETVSGNQIRGTAKSMFAPIYPFPASLGFNFNKFDESKEEVVLSVKLNIEN